MVRLFDAAMDEGGEELARRQIEAELAFWRGAGAEGWQIFTTEPDTGRTP